MYLRQFDLYFLYVSSSERVEQLSLNQKAKPGTHPTQKEIARELNISRMTVRGILHNDLRLKCFKQRRSKVLTEANKLTRQRHPRKQS